MYLTHSLLNRPVCQRAPQPITSVPSLHVFLGVITEPEEEEAPYSSLHVRSCTPNQEKSYFISVCAAKQHEGRKLCGFHLHPVSAVYNRGCKETVALFFSLTHSSCAFICMFIYVIPYTYRGYWGKKGRYSTHSPSGVQVRNSVSIKLNTCCENHVSPNLVILCFQIKWRWTFIVCEK